MSEGQGLLWLFDFLGTVMQGQESIIKQLQQAQENPPEPQPPNPEQPEPKDRS